MPDLKTQNSWVDDTLALCGINPNGPTELLELLYEDFAVSAGTFLQPDTLQPLLAAGLLDTDLYKLCRLIEAKTDYLTRHPTLVSCIKSDARWQEIFALCAETRARKAILNQPTA